MPIIELLSETMYWFYFGIFYLIILTYQDYKNRMWVDNRHNYFMLGLSISLISHFNRPLWYFGVIMVISLFLNIFIKKYKLLGDADATTISWLYIGLAIISLMHLIIYAAVLILCIIVYFMFKKLLFRYKYATPFYPVLLISFSAFFLTNVI